MSLMVAAIADDDTGAMDLAGMLTAEGLRCVLVLDSACGEELKQWSQTADAIVVGTASRSVEPQEAYARTRAATAALLELEPRVVAIKYCSTFDSTTKGNIGPSIDAAMDVMGEGFTVGLVALPALGRTTYMGHHFVDDRLLSDSVLRHHPLNPMTNAHLPSHLASQTRRRIGLLRYDRSLTVPAARTELERLCAAGAEIVLLDCVDDAHLQRLCETIAGLRLITGSSAWAMTMPKLWRRSVEFIAKTEAVLTPQREAGGKGFLIVSGSCSEATRKQNERAQHAKFPSFNFDPSRLLLPTSLDAEVDAIADALAKGEAVVVSTGGADALQRGKEIAAERGVSTVQVGEMIALRLAKLTRAVFERTMPQGLIVAGGETSSAIMRALDLRGLKVGPNMEPGIPIGVALREPSLAVALKSGNFGSDDFYAKAIDVMRSLPMKLKKEESSCGGSIDATS